MNQLSTEKKEAGKTTVRFSATVEPEVFEKAKILADRGGFKHSFSAYVTHLMRREVEQNQQLLCAQA